MNLVTETCGELIYYLFNLNGKEIKMSDKKYGVTTCSIGGGESVLVQFGDGLTGIQSLGYDNGDAGVVLCRDGKHSEPFGFNEDKDTYQSGNDKVFLSFENERSIDVMIDRLNEAKSYL